MLSGYALQAALDGAPLRACSRLFVRAVELEYSADPASGVGALSRNGRYHLAGSGHILYLASGIDVLVQERQLKVLSRRIGFEPTAVFAIRVKLRRSVPDLCDAKIRASLNVGLADLKKRWLPASVRGLRAPTQDLGTAALNSHRIHALRVPSARTRSGFNLVVFLDRLSETESITVVGRP